MEADIAKGRKTKTKNESGKDSIIDWEYIKGEAGSVPLKQE